MIDLEAIRARNEKKKAWIDKHRRGNWSEEFSEVEVIADIDALLAEVERLRAIIGATDVPTLRRALVNAPTATEYAALERRIAEIDAAEKDCRKRMRERVR